MTCSRGAPSHKKLWLGGLTIGVQHIHGSQPEENLLQQFRVCVDQVAQAPGQGSKAAVARGKEAAAGRVLQQPRGVVLLYVFCGPSKDVASGVWALGPLVSECQFHYA